MRRSEIEAKVGSLIDAYLMHDKVRTVEQKQAADAAGRAIVAEIAVDTLFALHSIAESQARIAAALEKIASEDDLLEVKN